MSSITLTPDHLEITFTASEKVAGLVRDQSIPRSAITAVEVVDDGLRATEGMRAPGLGIPGRRKLGTWRGTGGKELVDVRHGEPALRLTLEGQPYRAVALGTPDAHDLARALQDGTR